MGQSGVASVQVSPRGEPQEHPAMSRQLPEPALHARGAGLPGPTVSPGDLAALQTPLQ